MKESSYGITQVFLKVLRTAFLNPNHYATHFLPQVHNLQFLGRGRNKFTFGSLFRPVLLSSSQPKRS